MTTYDPHTGCCLSGKTASFKICASVRCASRADGKEPITISQAGRVNQHYSADVEPAQGYDQPTEPTEGEHGSLAVTIGVAA